MHQAELYRYMRYLGAEGRGVAEDLVQDTFLVAFRHAELPSLDDVRRQSAWLRGVARNLFLAHCRQAKRSKIKVDSELVERAESVWTNEFLREGDGFDYVEALRKCLTRLQERERRLLDLRYGEQKSRVEMARMFQMTEDGIKSALQRVRAMLKDCILRRLDAEKTGTYGRLA